MTPLLTIMIPTLPRRRAVFDNVFGEILRQRELLQLTHQVQIIHNDDPLISLGAKGNAMLASAEGDYVARIDDDDWIEAFYLGDIMEALSTGPDCVGMRIAMTTDGKRPQVCCHSIKYQEWAENVDMFDYVRGATQFNPIRRELALQAGFPEDVPDNYGDDKVFADRVTPLCKTEVMLNRIVYNYRYLTPEGRKRAGTW